MDFPGIRVIDTRLELKSGILNELEKHDNQTDPGAHWVELVFWTKNGSKSITKWYNSISEVL